MSNLCCEEYNRYNSWLFKAKPTLVPIATPTYQPGHKETGSLLFSEVGSAPSISLEVFEGWQDSHSKHKHRLVHLQLPADDFIRHTEETLCKQQDIWKAVKQVTRFKSPHSVGNSSISACSLYPSTGEKRMEITEGRALFHKQPQFCYESMIDVEPSVTRNLIAYGKSAHKRVVETSTAKNEAEGCILSNATRLSMLRKTSLLDVAETTSGRLYGDYSQDQAPSRNLCNQVADKKQNFISYENENLDLNKVYMEDCEKQDGACSEDIADVHLKGNFVDLTLTDSNTDISVRDSNSIGISVVRISPSVQKRKLGFSVLNSEDAANCGCLQKLHFDLNVVPADVRLYDSEVNNDKSNVTGAVLASAYQSESTFQTRDDKKVPATCKRLSSENDSENGKTSQSVIEEASVMDRLDKRAAESLVLISSENSCCHQQSYTKMTSKKTKNEDLPRRSFDSYELLMLKQTESNVDDNSVTSKPFEDNCSTEAKKYNLKLRRGRRLKDFRREILPGLASLSRHEVREDRTLMEAVLRSKEYRKFRDETTAAQEGSFSTVTKRGRTRSKTRYWRR